MEKLTNRDNYVSVFVLIVSEAINSEYSTGKKAIRSCACCAVLKIKNGNKEIFSSKKKQNSVHIIFGPSAESTQHVFINSVPTEL